MWQISLISFFIGGYNVHNSTCYLIYVSDGLTLYVHACSWGTCKQDLLVPSLLSKGIEFAPATLSMTPGIPIKPMLAR